MPMARVTTFSIDDKTEETLEQLRKSLGASSNAEVLRRAVTLMGIAVKVAEQHGKLLIQDADGKSKEIVIS